MPLKLTHLTRREKHPLSLLMSHRSMKRRYTSCSRMLSHCFLAATSQATTKLQGCRTAALYWFIAMAIQNSSLQGLPNTSLSQPGYFGLFATSFYSVLDPLKLMTITNAGPFISMDLLWVKHRQMPLLVCTSQINMLIRSYLAIRFHTFQNVEVWFTLLKREADQAAHLTSLWQSHCCIWEWRRGAEVGTVETHWQNQSDTPASTFALLWPCPPLCSVLVCSNDSAGGRLAELCSSTMVEAALICNPETEWSAALTIQKDTFKCIFWESTN